MHPKQLLTHYQIEPKKSLGQNFLFDENVLARIVEAAEVQPFEPVLEIGPGLGSLTRVLAQTAASVTAVELDNRFIPILQTELATFANVRLVHGDILAQNLDALFERPYKVVANVPYYITGAILRHLLSAQNKPTTVVLTVQKEVAERVTAVPPQMSLLAVSTQLYGTAELVTTIKAGAFWPRPDVDSAVLRLTLYPQPLLPFAEEEPFFALVKAGFSQKRKQLKNNLQQLGYNQAEITAVLQAAGVDGRRRAETLSIDEWLTIHQQRPL